MKSRMEDGFVEIPSKRILRKCGIYVTESTFRKVLNDNPLTAKPIIPAYFMIGHIESVRFIETLSDGVD